VIKLRKSEERGHFDHGWLDTRHSFSFADYYDPEHMGFGHLRVINQDRVQPGRGFGTHGHRDMEILSYVLDGTLEHKDNMGNGSVIRPGDVQRMSAGTGVMHSEFNPSGDERVHFLQIWILPDRKGLAPGYEQKRFGPEARKGRLCLIASSDGADGSVTIHQDARVFAALLGADSGEVPYTPRPARRTWVQLATGKLRLNGIEMIEGDGAAIQHEPSLTFSAASPAEFLVFDLS
jgi:quercetin 2,3-dioxygenase